MNGWIKLHRQLLDNPIVMKDADHLAVWIYLLLNASHDEHPVVFGGEKITLHAGQLITGRKKIASVIGVNESKIFRILKSFKTEQQIEQRVSSRNSLITILNWELYQDSEQQIEQQMNNKRTTSEQQVNTNKNVRKKRMEEDYRVSKDTLSQTDVRLAVQQWNELSEFGIKPVSKCSSGSKRYDSLCARIREYGIEDVINAIDKIKVSDFLQGKNGKGWTITFDWFVKPSNFPKVLEGNYDNEESGNNECTGTDTRANETEYNPYDYY